MDRNEIIKKIDNMYVRIYTALMLDRLEEIDHFVSDDVYNKLKENLEEQKKKNIINMYDELNVKNTKILDIKETDDEIKVEVLLTSRYLDYMIKRDTKEFIKGNKKDRIEIKNYITLVKKKNAKEQQPVRKCPNCGSNMDINYSGKCIYCNSIYNLEDYDYVITKMEIR